MQIVRNPHQDKGKVKGSLLTVSAGVCFGTIPFFVTWLNDRGIGVGVQVTARLLISLLFLAVVIVFTRDSFGVLKRNNLLFFITNGVLVLAGFATYTLSITLGTTPLKAILLIYLYPVFSIALSALFLKESITAKKVLAAVVGVLGAAVTLKFWEINNVGQLQMGDLFAIMNGIIYASIVILGRRGGARSNIPTLVMLFWTFSFAIFGIAILLLVTIAYQGGSRIIAYFQFNNTSTAILCLLGIGIFSTALPFILMYKGLHTTESSIASVLLLSEPISVLVMTSAFLGEPINFWQVIGGMMIIGAGLFIR